MEEAASSHWTSTHVICLRVGQQRLFRKHIKPRTAKKSNKSDVLRVLWSMERLVIVSNIPMSKYWFPMRYGSCVVSFPLIAENSSGRPSRIRSRRWLKRNVCHRQQNTFSAATKKIPFTQSISIRAVHLCLSRTYIYKKKCFSTFAVFWSGLKNEKTFMCEEEGARRADGNYAEVKYYTLTLPCLLSCSLNFNRVGSGNLSR